MQSSTKTRQLEDEIRSKDAELKRLQAQLDAAEAEKRAPLIKRIIDAAPVFREDDFTGWTTEHLTDLADRVERHNDIKARINDAYAKKAGV
ncbi:hypothetical protein ANME2D_00711 [Candidatus Methanoperedens nitroreducens]|uniref:Uncharacterized protein n=1 Tax=Candidatus Methanoperedens nitratireducens TaxID=1392998 RepID=A0A062VD98_9EURY|nr:hypothetical protein [Candidatus Methanoperedens nitroreducens]KCZ73639.1 hypothetical protein ANME2D_00711 [Candidatus Methanoperedens nitroreducens]MDJ1422401.1 hypothetical protein [Candidatus Methanoperedens sp.]